MQEICRICIQPIADFNFVVINNDERCLQVTSQLSLCIPEMNLNVIEDPIICGTCVSTLHLAFNFKNKCLQTEERIWNYIQSKDLDSESIDISDVYEKTNTPYPELPFMVAQKNVHLPFTELMSSRQHDIYRAAGLPDDYVIKMEDNVTTEGQVDFEFVNVENDMSELNRNFDNNASNVFDTINSENNVSNEEINLANNPTDPQLLNCWVVLSKIDATNLTTENIAESSREESKSNVEWHDTENLLLERSIDATSSSDLHHTDQRHEHNTEGSSTDLAVQNLKKPSTSKQKKPHTCKLCTFKTFYKKQFLFHKKIHNITNAFNCKQCKYSAVTKQSLKKHMRTHDTKKCRISSGGGFKTVRSKSQQLPIVCKVCGNHFSSKHSLIRHKKTHYSLNCTLCNAKFAHKKLLKDHIQVHLRENILVDCNTEKKSYVKGSRTICNRRKRYTCTICQRNFILESNLIRHQSVHSTELICAMCNTKFSCKNVFLGHIKSHIC